MMTDGDVGGHQKPGPRFSLTHWLTKEDTSSAAVAMAPPAKTVALMPKRSTRMPASGEQHRVKPKVRDPISAAGKK